MSKIIVKEKKLDYSSSKIGAYVGNYTGKVNINIPITSVGDNNYLCELNIIYDSEYDVNMFSDKQIGLHNGLKFNIQQYVFKYKNIYNISGFTEEDYVYIDSSFLIHRFTKPEGSSSSMYYDQTYGNLYLYVNNDLTFKIVDDNENQLNFDNEGRLINIISGINKNIKKIIKYTNNLITEYYDERNITRKILFEYNDCFKIKVSNLIKNINYNIDINDNLLKISKYNLSETKKYIIFKNDDLNKCIYDYETNEGIEFLLSDDKKVIEVRSGIADKEYQTKNGSKCYLGENLYVGESNYLGETQYIISDCNYYLDDNYINNKDTFTYYPFFTMVKNKDNIKIGYFFNSNGETINCFEIISTNNYKSLEEERGLLISDNNNDNDFKINGLNYKAINNSTSFKYQFSEAEIETIDNELNLPININYDYFNLSFFAKFNESHSSDIRFKLYINNEYIDTCIISKALAKTVFKVNIPINFKNYYSDFESLNHTRILNSMYILADGLSGDESVLINEFRMSIINNQDVYIGNVKLTNNSYISYIKNNQNEIHKISSDYYLTNKDIYNTYKNMYKSNGNYLLSLCNGTKLIEVSDSSLSFDNLSQMLLISDEGLTNYNVKVNKVIDYASKYESIKTLKFETDENDKLITYDIEHTNITNGNNLYETSVTIDNESKYCNGLKLYTRKHERKLIRNLEENIVTSQDDNEILYETKYDDYGNILTEKTTFSKPNVETQVLQNTYDYGLIVEKCREHVLSVSKDNVNLYYEYYPNGLLKSINNGKLIKEYVYDDFLEKVIKIKFINSSTLEVVSENNIDYKNDSIKSIINTNNEKYYFSNNYYGNINEVYDEFGRISSNMFTYELLYKTKEKYYNKQTTDREVEKVSEYSSYNQLRNTIIDDNNDTKIEYTYYNDRNSKYGSKLKKVTTKDYVYEYEYNNLYNSCVEKVNDEYLISTNYFGMNGIALNEGDKVTEQFNDNNCTMYRIYNNNGIFNSPRELQFIYDYDGFGNFKSKKWNILSSTKYIEKELSYEKNRINQLSYNFKLNNNDEDYFFTYTYDYDFLNNLIGISEAKCNVNDDNIDIVNQLSQKHYTYNYDEFNRLTKEIIDNDTYEYVYDNNQLSKIYLNNNLIKQYIYDNNRLIRYIDNNSYNIEYDKQGNMIKVKDKDLIYDIDNRLGSCIYNENNRNYVITYKYNYKGERVRKEIKETLSNGSTNNTYIDFYVNNGIIIGEDRTNNGETQKYRYFYDKEGITGIEYNNSIYNFIKDILGNVNKVVHNGNIIGEYTYDAWGNVTVKKFEGITTDEIHILDNNPFRYRGYYYDVETNLFLVSSRYYSPELCRWISPDDIEYLDPENVNGLNLYCYCLNDPVNNYDPTGHFAISLGFLIGSIVIGAAFGAGFAGVTAYKEGERGLDLAWDIVGGGIFGAAVGATVALGGAAGLAATGAQIAVGATTTVLNVSMGAALGISIGGMAFAGATKYSLDCAASERQWNIGGYLVEAAQGAIQGAATFGLAYLGGKAGLFNKIGNFKGWYDFYMGYGGMNKLKMISYMSNLIMGPTLSKMLLISGVGAGMRWLIDKIIPEI